MKSKIAVIFVMLYALNGTTQVTDFLGVWHAPENNNSTIKITQDEKGEITAVIIDSDEKAGIGHVLITDGVYNSDKNEIKCTLHRAGSSMKVGTTITKESDEMIKVVGKKFLIKKTFYWSRNIESKK